jgi:hypothetical protein
MSRLATIVLALALVVGACSDKHDPNQHFELYCQGYINGLSVMQDSMLGAGPPYENEWNQAHKECMGGEVWKRGNYMRPGIRPADPMQSGSGSGLNLRKSIGE